MSNNIITDQNISDILSSAFDGGITYWCDKVEVIDGDYKGAEYASDAVAKGAAIKLHVHDYDGEVKVLNRESLIKGLERAAEHYGRTVYAYVRDHDAGEADIAVQFAVFGELVFG